MLLKIATSDGWLVLSNVDWVRTGTRSYVEKRRPDDPTSSLEGQAWMDSFGDLLSTYDHHYPAEYCFEHTIPENHPEWVADGFKYVIYMLSGEDQETRLEFMDRDAAVYLLDVNAQTIDKL